MLALAVAALVAGAGLVWAGVFSMQPRRGGGSSGGAGTLLDLIKHYEGFHANVYTCPAGYRTIGYGHVLTGDEPPEPWTESQAADYLAAELLEYETLAREAWEERTGRRWVDLSESARAAYTSAVYNTGPRIILNGSWPVKTNPAEAAEVFYSWSKGGGVRLAGLVRRRFTEWKLARTGVLDFDPPGWREWYNEHKG